VPCRAVASRRRALVVQAAGDRAQAVAVAVLTHDSLDDLEGQHRRPAQADAGGSLRGKTVASALTDQPVLVLRGVRDGVRYELAGRRRGVDPEVEQPGEVGDRSAHAVELRRDEHVGVTTVEPLERVGQRRALHRGGRQALVGDDL